MRINFWYISSLFISIFVIIPILTVFLSFFETTSNYYQILKDTFLSPNKLFKIEYAVP